MDDIKQFTAKMSTDPAFSCDIVPKFYLNASLALWYDLVFDFDCCIGALSLIFFYFLNTLSYSLHFRILQSIIIDYAHVRVS